MKQCRVTACDAPTASRFSPHCRFHKSRLRRQGDAGQTAIKIGELAPYRERVLRRIAKNQHSPLWAHLDDVWAALVAEAETDAGRRVQNRYERQAATMIIGLAGDTPTREIIVTSAAMFLLLTDRPHRFESDAAFRLQLAKRVLSHSYVNTALRYDHGTGKQVRFHREPSPRARAIIGRKLSSAFGPLGLRLARLEAEERAWRARETYDIRRAMMELV